MTRSEREPFTDSFEPFTNTATADVDVKVPKQRKARPNLRCATPKSLQFRFKYVVDAERRSQSVVIDKMIGDFLANKEYEPRPYIPDEIVDEDTVSIAYTINGSMYDEFCHRAKSEGRTPQALFVRAMHDYVHNSPDDPMKNGVELPAEILRSAEQSESDHEDENSGGGSE